MSIPVALDDLQAATSDYGWAYLLTVSDDQTPHIVAVTPVWDGDALRMEGGRRTAGNASERTSISLCYPPTEAGGYSLIVDGVATVDAPTIRVAPSGAVLHRPATPGSEGSVTGCASDCAPIPTAD
ncbi:MAG: hypothetical protein WBP59_09910 [Ilumatobacteraceae bacterium]